VMDTTDQPLERQTDLPRNHLGSMRSILPPQLLPSLVPFRPSIHPRSASLQDAGNPTDRLPLQPESDTSFPFIDQPRSFFASYADPPWEGLYPNCTVMNQLAVSLSRITCHVTLSLYGTSFQQYFFFQKARTVPGAFRPDRVKSPEQIFPVIGGLEGP
jgi:hypothetical protein